MNFTTLQVTFPNSMQPYTYKATQEQADFLKTQRNQLVIVESRSKFLVCEVLGIDDEPRENDPRFDYKWIVQPLDLTTYHTLLSQDGFTGKT